MLTTVMTTIKTKKITSCPSPLKLMWMECQTMKYAGFGKFVGTRLN
jgi:hypothetical protein